MSSAPTTPTAASSSSSPIVSVSLVPKTKNLKNTLRGCGHNPYLKLNLRPSMTLTRLFRHLRRIWTRDNVCITGDQLFFLHTASRDASNQRRTWDESVHGTTTVGEIHEALGQPSPFMLRYGTKTPRTTASGVRIPAGDSQKERGTADEEEEEKEEESDSSWASSSTDGSSSPPSSKGSVTPTLRPIPEPRKPERLTGRKRKRQLGFSSAPISANFFQFSSDASHDSAAAVTGTQRSRETNPIHSSSGKKRPSSWSSQVEPTAFAKLFPDFAVASEMAHSSRVVSLSSSSQPAEQRHLLPQADSLMGFSSHPQHPEGVESSSPGGGIALHHHFPSSTPTVGPVFLSDSSLLPPLSAPSGEFQDGPKILQSVDDHSFLNSSILRPLSSFHVTTSLSPANTLHFQHSLGLTNL